MKHHRRQQSGYSLPEMLVVIAIIGIISLVTIPQFLAFQRANQLKTAMRQVMADLRLARQQAVALRTQTRVRFRNNTDSYVVERLNTDGSWGPLGRTTTGLSARALEKGCKFTVPADPPSNLPTATVGGETFSMVVFRPDGTAALTDESGMGRFIIRSTASNLARPSYTIQVQGAGFVKAI